MNLIIKNCKMLIGNELVEKDLFISDGKIKKIDGQVDDAFDERIDARGLVALPGLIDAHVHFREPGLSHKEDWKTGSSAAVAGGVTTVLDMPNTKPPTFTKQLLDEKRELARKSVVDYGFHFGASATNSDEIKKTKNEVASTKLYMNHTTGELLVTEDVSVKSVFDAARRVTVHAEGETMKDALRYALAAQKRIHIAHVSSASEVRLLGEHKKNGMISAEVTPHHLFLTEHAIKELGPFACMKPCLKSSDDVDALWMGIHEGIIDCVATDHAPHTREEKESGNPSFGVPGIETMLSLLLDAVNKGRITLRQLIALTSERPASVFGIKNKGKIVEGCDADITLVDTHLIKKVKEDALFTKCGWSPFRGWELRGWPVMTIVRGSVVFRDGQVIPHQGKGVLYV